MFVYLKLTIQLTGRPLPGTPEEWRAAVEAFLRERYADRDLEQDIIVEIDEHAGDSGVST